MAIVVLIGTLDTKGREYAYVKDILQRAGVETILIDVGVLGEPPLEPDFGAAEVARLGGFELRRLRHIREGSDTRAHALEVMGRGAGLLVGRLRREGRCDGVLGLGGSGGSSVIAAAMRVIPLGVPKLLVSTMTATRAAADFVGTSDICLVSPVTDIAGLNRVSRTILANAAHAMAGMVLAENPSSEGEPRPLVALTMMGVTTPCVLRLQVGLEERGFETIVFHAVGNGGRAMEEMLRDGQIDAVCDVTTHELTDDELGGLFGAGPDRLTAAGALGRPFVAVPGAMEFVNFGSRDTVPSELDVPERVVVVHNPSVCAVRINREESARVGRLLAERVNCATGPAAVVLPLHGCSKYELADGPFVDPQADEALFEAIRGTLRSDIPLREIEANLNAPEFADAVLETFLDLWDRR